MTTRKDQMANSFNVGLLGFNQSDTEKLKKIFQVTHMALAATQSILVSVGQTVYAFAEQGVKQIFSSLDGEIVETDGDTTFIHDQRHFPVEHLNALLKIQGNSQIKAADKPGLLIEDRAGEQTVVIVDAIIARQDLIIKSLGQYVPDIPGILGASILGSGEVSVVLDLHELMSVRHEFHFETEALYQELLTNTLPLILVADDSLSARKATSQLITDNGYDVQTAIDGLDALEKIESQKPDLIILDMEMPRMNGVELANHIRNREDLCDLPIMMITSRSTEKHRQQAGQAGINHYLTKPFAEDDLISSIRQLL